LAAIAGSLTSFAELGKHAMGISLKRNDSLLPDATIFSRHALAAAEDYPYIARLEFWN
jgi:hypothetical protein